jgi:hypothetical protein
MANADKPKQEYLAGLKALEASIPDTAKLPETEEGGIIMQKTCPKCPGSPEMSAARYIAIIPAMNDENFVGVEKISKTGGFPVQAYECPRCHFVELYRAE